LVQWVLKNPDIHGAVNAVSLEPVTMEDFCRILGKALHRPSWLPVPGWALHMALGDLATVMTTGQRVAPTVVIRSSFTYGYPALESALQSLIDPNTRHTSTAKAAGF
jgi:NAD dependent epimerase/dehydratase family enzyme